MIFLWPEIQRNVARAVDTFRLPDGVDVVPSASGTALAARPIIEHGTSGDTTLSWEWIDEGRVIVSGDFLYAPDLKRPNGYPSWLLKIAEQGLDATCPPASPPRDLFARTALPPGVSAIDDSGDELESLEGELSRALIQGAAIPCRSER